MSLASYDVVSLIPVRDPDRSRVFYQEILGLRFIVDDGFAQVFEINGRFLRLTKVDDFTPQPFSIIGWMVDDIAAAVGELADKGVTFERYPYFQQDEQGVWAVPDGSAKIAWFLDPDGNNLSLVESQPIRP